GLTALGNSSVWDNVSNNDGTPAGVCNLANLLNGPGGSCAGVSIVENPGVSLVITEQSEFAIATIASGFVYTFSAVVPVPAAVWLFGSAIGLLGFVRRRMNLA
ncbi:MAG: VPLPA-CTERM sorting domain-containing protein, partial [Gammaproteobacteria bacterium]